MIAEAPHDSQSLIVGVDAPRFAEAPHDSQSLIVGVVDLVSG